MIKLPQSVTLTQGQSISLITGKITDVATANQEANPQARLRNRNLKGLRANYLVALQYLIEKDPTIRSV
jgi:hypothetical protein